MTHKKCTKCGVVKPIDCFGRHKRDKVRSNCLECWREASRLWRLNNPNYMREWNKRNGSKPNLKSSRFYKYGITQEQYETMVAEQGGKCATCFEIPNHSRCGTVLFVDHDHDTGKVRGLLCMTCNLIEGYAKSKPHVLRNIAEYIEQHANERG